MDIDDFVKLKDRIVYAINKTLNSPPLSKWLSIITEDLQMCFDSEFFYVTNTLYFDYTAVENTEILPEEFYKIIIENVENSRMEYIIINDSDRVHFKKYVNKPHLESNQNLVKYLIIKHLCDYEYFDKDNVLDDLIATYDKTADDTVLKHSLCEMIVKLSSTQ